MKGISLKGLEAAKKCKKIYLENYTVDFPYPLSELTDVIGKKVEFSDREKVENLSIIDEAQKTDIALLVYGSPLTATTHITLIHEAKLSRVKCKVIHAGSIFDAVAETGLQLYKFGKVTSMPAWQQDKNFTPDSFMEIVKQNQSIDAHSLILCDIGLTFVDGIQQLKTVAENHKIKLKKLIVCQAMGTKSKKVIYKSLKELEEMRFIRNPYCIIIPGKLQHYEKEVLESFD